MNNYSRTLKCCCGEKHLPFILKSTLWDTARGRQHESRESLSSPTRARGFSRTSWTLNSISSRSFSARSLLCTFASITCVQRALLSSFLCHSQLVRRGFLIYVAGEARGGKGQSTTSMEVLPEGPLASILHNTPLPESGAISVVCRHWNCVLRDVVHRTMTREL